jgi:F-type H+-transporting ATPase subunit delta
VDDAVSRRYAQAMIDAAGEANAVEAVGADLSRFLELMDADHELLGGALASPVFSQDERRAVLDAVLPRLGFHPLTNNLLRLVNDKRRFDRVHDIVEAFRGLADDRAGRARVTVQTAEPLTPQLEAEVRQALEAVTRKTVVLRTEVRPELIGGLVAKVGDVVYDSSIRTRLEQIKQALLDAPVTAQA